LKGKPFVFLLVTISLVGIGVLPILDMFAKSVVVDGHATFSLYGTFFSSSRWWTLLGNSLALSLLTTIVAVAVGLPLGVLCGKSDLPLRRTFLVLFAVPLLLPPYITAVSWSSLFGKAGLLTRAFGPLIGSVTSTWFFGLPGCVLVLSTAFMPIAMLLTVTYLRTLNPHVEEAARLVASWPSVLKGITIPTMLPGLLLAAILIFLLAMGEFSVPMFLRFDVFPVESFTRFSALHDFGAGTAAVAPVAVIVFVILGAERVFLREKTYQLRPTSADASGLRINLGLARWAVFTLVGLICLATVLAPLAALIIQSSSLSTYADALARAGGSLVRSVVYALIGASLLSGFGFFSGYFIHTRAFSFWRALDSLTVLLFAMPSTVIGIGLVGLWNRPSTDFVYGTPVIVLLGFLAQYAMLTSRITVSTLAHIPPSMEEAARAAGAGWLRSITLILAPLAKRGLICGWLVAYIFCLRDTGISMIVYPAGLDTLTVRTFTLMANAPPELVASLCVIMMVTVLVPLSALLLLFRARRPAA
jgi:iron(III) transport system permease protein